MTTELATWRELAETGLGWPEWEEEISLRSVFSDPLGDARTHALRWRQKEGFWVGWISESGGFYWHHRITDHEAESLFERHARTWLEERNVCVRHSLRGKYAVSLISSTITDDLRVALGLGEFDTYTAAQQAAVRAAHKEGKPDADKH